MSSMLLGKNCNVEQEDAKYSEQNGLPNPLFRTVLWNCLQGIQKEDPEEVLRFQKVQPQTIS